MFGDVIQILSISNLKAPGSRWRCTGKCSEATNASKEMSEGKQLDVTIAARDQQNEQAAASRNEGHQRKNEGTETIQIHRTPLSHSHPHHVGDHSRSSSCDPAGIRTQIARLHVTRLVRDMARGVG